MDRIQQPKYRRYEREQRKQQLVDAAIACLAEGGMAAFTIDNICRHAGVSRGLISHHFSGKSALLEAAYEAMTRHLDEMAAVTGRDGGGDPAGALRETVETSFADDAFNRGELKAWLALWGEVAGNPELKVLHHQRYTALHDGLVQAIDAIALDRGKAVDADRLATMLIALIDGLWLEWCLDPDVLSHEEAKAACYALLEPALGRIR